MPVSVRRPLFPLFLTLASLAVSAGACAAEPPALLPSALLRQDSDGPPPPAVNDPVRVRQALRPDTTYEVRLQGTMKVAAEDERFFPLIHLKGKITLDYLFDARIERRILYNDGQKIVEDRSFDRVQTILVGSNAQNVTVTLSPLGQLLFDLTPLGALVPGGQLVALEATLLEKCLKDVGPLAEAVRNRRARGFRFGALASLDGLSGKTVRLTYVDGRGVLRLEPVRGQITPEERAFHMDSVLLSDCLLFPSAKVGVGQGYDVPGEVFGDRIDPSLLAHVGGKVRITRGENQRLWELGQGDATSVVTLKVGGGQLDFLSGRAIQSQMIGNFRPQGTIYFDPQQQLIVSAELNGQGSLQIIPERHLLYHARKIRQPSLELRYSCRILEQDR